MRCDVIATGSETWTMRKENIKILEALEMWIWRRVERVSWVELRRNEARYNKWWKRKLGLPERRNPKPIAKNGWAT